MNIHLTSAKTGKLHGKVIIIIVWTSLNDCQRMKKFKHIVKRCHTRKLNNLKGPVLETFCLNIFGHKKQF